VEIRDDVDVQPGRRRRPLQYSLRSMFVLTTAAAVGLSLLVAGPHWLIMLVLVIVALAIPMLLTIALIYGRGAIRTFSIGALFPAGAVAISVIPIFFFPPFLGRFGPPGRLNLEERFLLTFFLVVACAVMVGFGLLSVWGRRMVEAMSGQRTRGSDPRTGLPIDTEETRPGAGTGTG